MTPMGRESTLLTIRLSFDAEEPKEKQFWDWYQSINPKWRRSDAVKAILIAYLQEGSGKLNQPYGSGILGMRDGMPVSGHAGTEGMALLAQGLPSGRSNAEPPPSSQPKGGLPVEARIVDDIRPPDPEEPNAGVKDDQKGSDLSDMADFFGGLMGNA